MHDRALSEDALSQLMRKAQQGDAKAYVELLCVITPRLRRIVSRRRGFAGAAEAEDIVQEVLLTVHSVRATYDAGRPFVPWLLAIVRHRLADGARRYARTAGREVGVDFDDVTFPELVANPEGEELGDAAALHAAVRDLPDGQRQAIQLVKIEERSLQEAAAISGATVGALKVATHRALAALKRKLVTKDS